MEPRTSFLTQSDLVADAEGWAEGEKSEQLALCLRGNAAGVLGAMPPFFQQNFRERRRALDRRFSDGHQKEQNGCSCKLAEEKLRSYSNCVPILSDWPKRPLKDWRNGGFLRWLSNTLLLPLMTFMQ